MGEKERGSEEEVEVVGRGCGERREEEDGSGW